MTEEAERYSKAHEAEIITDPEERARQEARNGLRQFDGVIEQVQYWLQPDRPFKLRPSGILGLHRLVLEGISSYAGVFRPAEIAIKGSKHEPPKAHLVPELVEELCDYVNANWHKSAIHLSAYTLWRMNWIHPFVDGNGRTARAVSYLVLCVRTGYRLPGTQTIPEQIALNKTPYYGSLESADSAFSAGRIDVSEMEVLIEALLAKQLVSVYEQAKKEIGERRDAKQS